MGPTNVALVKLLEADRRQRDAQANYEAAAHNVRIQERRVHDLTEKLRLAQQTFKDQQSKAATLELDIKIRDQHIEKLRGQQQGAKNNKEYQAFLIEINTRKVDRGKVEEQTMALIDSVEKQKTEVAALTTHLETERAKLDEMKTQIGDTLVKLQAEVDATKPARIEAEAAVPPKARDIFNRLADRYEGEAMAGIDRPDRRKEEYLCTACNMELVRDIYNKLNSRDEVVFCPNCQRMLFIPEHFTAEHAIGGPGKTPTKKKTTVKTVRPPKKGAAAAPVPVSTEEETIVVIEARASGDLGKALAMAQGESVRRAVKSDTKPVECEVIIDGELAGIYKGISVENLTQAVKYFMGEMKLTADTVEVKLVESVKPEEPTAEPAPVVAEPVATEAPATETSGVA